MTTLSKVSKILFSGSYLIFQRRITWSLILFHQMLNMLTGIFNLILILCLRQCKPRCHSKLNRNFQIKDNFSFLRVVLLDLVSLEQHTLEILKVTQKRWVTLSQVPWPIAFQECLLLELMFVVLQANLKLNSVLDGTQSQPSNPSLETTRTLASPLKIHGHSIKFIKELFRIKISFKMLCTLNFI